MGRLGGGGRTQGGGGDHGSRDRASGDSGDSDDTDPEQLPEWWKNAIGGEWAREGNRWRGGCPVCAGRLELRAGGPGTYVMCFGRDCAQKDIARAVEKRQAAEAREKAELAVTEAWEVKPEPAPDPEPEPEAEPEEDAHWTESFPSRFLGGLDSTMYFIPEAYGQVVTYSAGQLQQRGNLMMLAPTKWYAKHFPRGSKGSVDWDSAVNAIVTESKRVGTFQPGRLRGRGLWRDDEKPLLHLGDRLLPPHGQEVRLTRDLHRE